MSAAGEPARRLADAGHDTVPLRAPLSYPGRWVDEPSLLRGDHLLPLGSFPVSASGRVAVLAVGSNGSPAQLHHKLTRAGVSRTVPLVPVRVSGLAVGLSGHLSRAGYVAASPCLCPGADTSLTVTWLTPAQLAALDATELPNYWRAYLPAADVPVSTTDGRPLPADGVHVYVNARGLLSNPDGSPRRTADQRTVISSLLAESDRLRTLFGPTPDTWVRRALADPGLSALGTAAFHAEGWVRPHDGFRHFARTGA
ncbi:hypothetical protein GL263_10330 [Streptomyces durbertensis]|uniref:Uncharacterized protein n=1 Tax=Streptomyces durbertensis TaxID=2448886 RepID=A0ABR6EF39_9ACTN|nr:hypothetical protein [Streptomyces durbertensis]MBB1243949.1 hypothetical protein [Streptomyces durbertensis]